MGRARQAVHSGRRTTGKGCPGPLTHANSKMGAHRSGTTKALVYMDVSKHVAPPETSSVRSSVAPGNCRV
eukprot:11195212-Lingulodinium_polyedra.AAC.1